MHKLIKFAYMMEDIDPDFAILAKAFSEYDIDIMHLYVLIAQNFDLNDPENSKFSKRANLAYQSQKKAKQEEKREKSIKKEKNISVVNTFSEKNENNSPETYQNETERENFLQKDVADNNKNEFLFQKEDETSSYMPDNTQTPKDFVPKKPKLAGIGINLADAT